MKMAMRGMSVGDSMHHLRNTSPHSLSWSFSFDRIEIDLRCEEMTLLSGHSKDAIWRVDYLDEVVAREVLALPADMQAKLARIVDLLASWGPHRVGMPYTRPLGEKLWEIRLSGRAGIARVIYVAVQDRRLILVHAFVKKTQKTPSGAITTALRRMKDIK